MQNRWHEKQAAQHTDLLQQRVYTSRLLGEDPALVLPGPGEGIAAARWTTLEARQENDTLTLSSSAKLSTPVLYRIEGWPAAPASLEVEGDGVRVNQGGETPRADDEDAVNGAAANGDAGQRGAARHHP